MKSFLLNKNVGINFSIFSFAHIVLLFITYVLFLLIIINKNRIKNISSECKKIIRIFFGLILLVAFIVRRGSFIYYGVYDIKYHLDLGFCSATALLFIIYCFSGSKKIYKFCYYAAFAGPLLSILFPSINISINNYSFVVFVLFHNVIFLMNLIFCLFQDMKKNTVESIKIAGIYDTYLFVINILNLFLGWSYNKLSNFIPIKYLNNKLIYNLSNNLFIELIVYLITTIICLLFSNYILDVLGGKYEKKKNIKININVIIFISSICLCIWAW